MAESNIEKEIAELRQALSLVHIDLLLHKGFAGSARWKAERGVDVALPEFDAAARVAADTLWPEGSREAAKAFGEVLVKYREAISAFDATSENEYRTRLIQALWELKDAVFGWKAGHAAHG